MIQFVVHAVVFESVGQMGQIGLIICMVFWLLVIDFFVVFVFRIFFCSLDDCSLSRNPGADKPIC